MIAYTALICSMIACIAATWGVYVLWGLPDRIIAKLENQIIEVVDEPSTVDHDQFSRPASANGQSITKHALPPDGLTHAQREERVLRRGVHSWRGHVHGA